MRDGHRDFTGGSGMNLFRRFFPKPPQVVKVKMRCVDCGKAVHKRERFQIVSVKHKDCHDPKLVGQKSLEGK